MKRIITILSVAAAAALLAPSCSKDMLQLENPNSLSSSTAYTYESDLDAALVGVYHAFNGGFFNSGMSIIFGSQSDEGYSYSPAMDLVDFVSFKYPNYDQNWNVTQWKCLYNQIARCNQVITYIENVEEWKEFSKEQILAQAKAIRAWDYYMLTMLYQHPPYVDYIAPAGDQPAQTPYETLCEKIIEDAKYAYDNLPSDYLSGPWKGQYRVTKWFAATLLGRVNMNSGNYAEAAKWFKDVIDNGKSVGGEKLALVDDYLWNSDDAHENNKEAVFELQFAKGNANAGYFAAYGWGWNDGATPDHRNWRWKLMCPSPVGWGDFCAETWLVYAFKNEKTVKNTPRTTAGQFDQRLECSLFYLDIWKDYPGHAQWQWGEGYEEKVDAGELEAPGWYNNGSYWTGDRVFTNKYTNWYGGDYNVKIADNEPTNVRVFRLGEILMDYAECLAQTGDLKGAIDQIDIVRQRAGLAKLADREPIPAVWTNPLTDEVIDFNKDYGYAAIKSGNYTLNDVMSVIDLEDMKETCYDSERNVNLRRWGVGGTGSAFYKRVAARSSKYKNQFAPHKVWIPIPQSEVKNNPNLEQIEGY